MRKQVIDRVIPVPTNDKHHWLDFEVYRTRRSNLRTQEIPY